MVSAIAIVVASTLAWPVLQLTVLWLRFRELQPNGPVEALVFAPMGFAAGLFAAILMNRASSKRQRRFVVSGYLVASPIAFIASLVSGLTLPGAWGPLVFGGTPLILGCAIGFAAGRRRGNGLTSAST